MSQSGPNVNPEPHGNHFLRHLRRQPVRAAERTLPAGRAYKLTVQYAGPGGSGSKDVVTQSGWEPEALRITFDILQNTVGSPFWYADISIYNLNDPTIQNYLFQALLGGRTAGMSFD